IYLGLLQASAVIDVDCLRFGVEIEDLPTPFPVPVAGLFDASKRHVRLGTDGGAIDVGNPCLDILHGAKGQAYIACIDARGQAVPGVVGNLYGLLIRAYTEDGKDRTEDLFLCDPHSGLHAREDGRFEEESVVETISRSAMTTQTQLRAFLPAYLDITRDLVERLLMDERSHLDAVIVPIAQLEFFRLLDESIHKFIMDAVLKDQAACCRAALARGPKGAPEYALEGKIEVGIVQHDLRILAPHLHREALVHPTADLSDL